MNAADDEVPAIINLADDIGAIFLDSQDVTHTDSRVLRLLTIGTQGITTGAKNPDHVMTYVDTPKLKFVIYGTGERVIPPVGQLSAMDVATTMSRLANQLNSQHMAVRGFIRASTIINGRIIAENLAPPVNLIIPATPKNTKKETLVRKPRRTKKDKSARAPARAPPQTAVPAADVAGPSNVAATPVEEEAAEPALVYRWMTSLFETGGIFLPRPIGNNFLWTILLLDKKNRPNIDLYLHDYECLSRASLLHRIFIGAGVAALLSLSVSSIFNKFNLTGRELNSYKSTAPGARRAMPLLETLFSVDHASKFGSIRLFSSACAVVSQFTACSINASCIATDNWCAYYQQITCHTEKCLWQAAFALRIPYMVNVASISWAFVCFLDVWGMHAAAGSFNLNKELLLAGPPENRGIHMYCGEVRYMNSVVDTFGYEFIPHGLYVINIIRHVFRVLVPWWITLTPLDTAAGPSHVRALAPLLDPGYQPIYWPGINVIEPGTLLSYDWVMDCVLSPNVLAADLGEDLWKAIMVTHTVYVGAIRSSP